MENYIKDYCSDFKFNFVEHISSKTSDILIDIDVYEAQKITDGIINHREKALVTLKKDNLKYQCEFFDEHIYENCFFEIKLNGHSYLLFRKALYGFTLIDTETLCEFYNYVPQAIKTGEESFIIVDAKQMDKILVFDGCYWACPYECFVFDFEKKLFVNISNYLDVNSLEESVVRDDKLILIGTGNSDNNIVKEISQKEITDLVDKRGCAEI